MAIYAHKIILACAQKKISMELFQVCKLVSTSADWKQTKWSRSIEAAALVVLQLAKVDFVPHKVQVL